MHLMHNHLTDSAMTWNQKRRGEKPYLSPVLAWVVAHRESATLVNFVRFQLP